MGQTLTNGVYLPDEGERNCYTGLARNWRAVDNHLGSTDIHVTINDKQAWNGHIADSVKHVTAEDKEAWNGKADASALTAHTGDTTIHVTSEDKAKWDAVTSKADDSDVVHKSGDETINGDKTFEGQLKLNAYSWVIRYKTQGTPNYPNYDTFKQIEYNKYNNIITLRRSSDVLNSGDNFNVVDTSFAFYKIHVRSKYVDLVDNTRFLNDGTNNYVVPLTDNATFFGSSSNKWKNVQTYQINSLEPSALGMPDLNNGIDISSYITHLDKVVNNYTPPANGWLSIRVKKTSLVHASLMIYQTGGLLSSCETDEFNISGTNLPVIANQNVEIYIYADVLVSAKFYPCQGNV